MNPKLKPNNQTDLNLNLDVSTNTDQLSSQNQQMMLLMMEMGTDKEVLAALLEIAAVSIHHVRWLAGPIIVQKSPWSDTIPTWLLKAIYRDRLEQIFTEMETGEIGELATPAEVMACIYPASMDAPLYRDWVDVYMWCGNEVFTKHKRLPKGKTFWSIIGQNPPIQFSSIKQDYNQIARDIRRTVIAQAKQRGWGKKQKSKPKNKTATNLSTPPEKTPNLGNDIVQISLF